MTEPLANPETTDEPPSIRAAAPAPKNRWWATGGLILAVALLLIFVIGVL
ncbi:hypothetical protein NYP18_04745 [Corynebacterium sp. YIM 101645]|uniref:Secreted protein n=1 Tax=Corynebacterium lemuris TaxID=1859292 RepID=A0ABT2FUS0_9CORY|nr:hypothetical protein [Corynebacterium lemuris]MCS5478962.1 hypothetical protein [Corynebacterium lemuris]